MYATQPLFPTILHAECASVIENYYTRYACTDTVLVVNSCARGRAVPGSDLDFAILVKPGTTNAEVSEIERCWKLYEAAEPAIVKYKQSGSFAHLHLDIVDGNFSQSAIGNGEPIDFFEVEIGNLVCYSAPMGDAGSYFDELRETWLPYYDETLRLQRLALAKDACAYDLLRIPALIQRALYFHAFDTLYKAFQEYLQCLFITAGVYPIAYNKWIKEQLVEQLKRPDLYARLLPILSVTNFESDEINTKANDLLSLLNDLG